MIHYLLHYDAYLMVGLKNAVLSPIRSNTPLLGTTRILHYVCSKKLWLECLLKFVRYSLEVFHSTCNLG